MAALEDKQANYNPSFAESLKIFFRLLSTVEFTKQLLNYERIKAYFTNWRRFANTKSQVLLFWAFYFPFYNHSKTYRYSSTSCINSYILNKWCFWAISLTFPTSPSYKNLAICNFTFDYNSHSLISPSVYFSSFFLKSSFNN